jgi:hypothetical protein
MKPDRHTIRSVEDLRRRVPAILRVINADESLALRAAANPLLALEELGYDISDELRPQIERRIRHGKAAIARLEALESRIYQLAGERFELGAPNELSRVLFERLKLRRVPKVQEFPLRKGLPSVPAAPEPGEPTALPRYHAGRPKHPDPLASLRDAHPIMGPLLEYRALEAGQPPLATREVYEKLKRAGSSGPTLRLRARIQSDAPPG